MRFVPAIALTLLLFASCKKEDDKKTTIPIQPNDSVSVLIQIVNRSGLCADSFMLVSNLSNNTLTSFVEYNNCSSTGKPYNKRFIYEGNKVFIIDSNSGSTSTDTLITDASKRILEWYNGQSGGTLYFYYNTAGQLTKTVSASVSFPNDTTLATFSNGDLITLASKSGDTNRYTYYLDKPVPASGYFTQQGLRFGSAYYVRNTHLLKSESFSGTTINYTYSYDAIGNVITKVATGNAPASTDTTHYRYTYPIP